MCYPPRPGESARPDRAPVRFPEGSWVAQKCPRTGRPPSCRTLSVSKSTRVPPLGLLRPHGSEARANLFAEQLRLLPGGKVSALGQLVVVNEPGIRAFRPTPRGWKEFVREDAHGHWDGNAFDVEIA